MSQTACPAQTEGHASHGGGHLSVELPPDAVLKLVERQIKGIAERTGAHLHVQHGSEGACIIIEGASSKVCCM